MSGLEFTSNIIGIDLYIRTFAAIVAAASVIYLVVRWLNNRL